MNVTKMVSQHSNEARINESCTSRNLVLSVSSFFESDCTRCLAGILGIFEAVEQGSVLGKAGITGLPLQLQTMSLSADMSD